MSTCGSVTNQPVTVQINLGNLSASRREGLRKKPNGQSTSGSTGGPFTISIPFYHKPASVMI